MGCYHIRYEFEDGAPALEALCAELKRRTDLDLKVEITHIEVKPTKATTDAANTSPSRWPSYSEVAAVRVGRSTADLELHRAENTVGVEFLFGGVWLRRYLETVTLDVVRRAGGRTKNGKHEEPPPWVELPWRKVPKSKLRIQALAQHALALGAYLVLPIVLPVLMLAAILGGRRRPRA